MGRWPIQPCGCFDQADARSEAARSCVMHPVLALKGMSPGTGTSLCALTQKGSCAGGRYGSTRLDSRIDPRGLSKSRVTSPGWDVIGELYERRVASTSIANGMKVLQYNVAIISFRLVIYRLLPYIIVFTEKQRLVCFGFTCKALLFFIHWIK